jgi:hypothetical protein
VEFFFYTFLEFKRIKPYSRNFFFKLMEVLMSLMSWIRRKLVFLIWLAAIILFAVGIFGGNDGGSGMNPCLLAGILTLAISYGPSIIFCLLGWGFRKLFKVEQKLKLDLEKNGYDPNQKV